MISGVGVGDGVFVGVAVGDGVAVEVADGVGVEVDRNTTAVAPVVAPALARAGCVGVAAAPKGRVWVLNENAR